MAAGLLLLLIFVAYGFLVARFHAARPTISRNYASELAARNASPQDQRAYPIYRTFVINQKKARINEAYPELASVANDTLPGEVGWSDAQKFAAQFAADLAAARQGASLLTLGGPYTDADDPIYFDQVIHVEDPSAIRDPGTPNPTLTTIHMAEFGWCRLICRSFRLDARVALAQGDVDRCHQNLLAMLGVARQAGDDPFLMGRIAHVSHVCFATQEIRRVLSESPQAFSEAQLISLFRALTDASRDTMKPNLDTEVLMFDDWLQRNFSDDGSGDGRLTAEGFENLQSFGLSDEWTYPPPESPYYKITAPFVPLIMANRAELKNAYDRLIAAAEQDVKRPLWDRPFTFSQAEFQNQDATRLLRARYLPVSVFMPSLGKAFKACELGAMDRDATFAAIAVEISRRRKGAYPHSLEELVPSLLPALPIDAWDGKTLKYRVKDGKPVLYSIGENQIDDAGAGAGDVLFMPQIRTAPKVSPARRPFEGPAPGSSR